MAFNRGFLSLLHGRLREWAPQQCIGDIFLGMVCTNIHVIIITMFSLHEMYSILVIDLGGIKTILMDCLLLLMDCSLKLASCGVL